MNLVYLCDTKQLIKYVEYIMKKRILISVITAMLIITGCSIDDLNKLEKTKSEDIQSTTNLEQKSIDMVEDLNYMIRGSCAYYDMFYDSVDN